MFGVVRKGLAHLVAPQWYGLCLARTSWGLLISLADSGSYTACTLPVDNHASGLLVMRDGLEDTRAHLMTSILAADLCRMRSSSPHTRWWGVRGRPASSW